MSCCIHATLKRAVDSFPEAMSEASGIYLCCLDSRNLFRSSRNSWDEIFFINFIIKIIKNLTWILFIHGIISRNYRFKKAILLMAYFEIYFVRGIASMYSYRGSLFTHAVESTYNSGLFHSHGMSTSYTSIHSILNFKLNR